MTNPNPFVPKGSLLEQQSKSRSRFKLAVSGVLAVSVIGLVAILIQGCKREVPATDSGTTDLTSNTPADMSASTNTDTYSNSTASAYAPPTNLVSAPMPPSGPQGAPQAAPYQPPVTPIAPAAPMPDTGVGSTEYVVVSGDTLGKIAHTHGVTVKALEAANPGVDPKKLHVKQKLNIPAGGTASAVSSAADTATGAPVDSGETYVVKSGDTLTKIAKAHHVKVKALQAENSLATTQIKVGQKLKIPASTEAAPAPAMSAPAPEMSAPPAAPATPAPAVPSAPAASAPGH